MEREQIFLSSYTSYDDLSALIGTPFTTEHVFGEVLQRVYGSHYQILKTNNSCDTFNSNLRGADFVIPRTEKPELQVDYKDSYQTPGRNTISIGPKTLKVINPYHFLGTIYKEPEMIEGKLKENYYGIFARTIDILKYKQPHPKRNWLHVIPLDVLKQWANDNNCHPILLTEDEVSRYLELKEKYQYIRQQCSGLTDKINAAQIAVNALCKTYINRYKTIPEFVFVNEENQPDTIVSPDASLYLIPTACF